MNYPLPEDRYNRDPAFKSLVDVMHAFIQRAEYTPTEMREAALLACIHHDRLNVRHTLYLDQDQFNMTETNRRKAPR